MQLLPKLRRLRYSIASTGLARTLMDVASHVTTYRAEDDHSFDRRYGTDTAGRIQTSELGITDAEKREQAILYLPSPARVTRWMLEHVGIEHRSFSFVDLGCGKGRVLLVAADYPFRRVVGVDISKELTEIATRNVAAYRSPERACADIRVHAADATTFEYPDTDLLVHLYHPFAPEVTAAVLTRLEASLARHPRQIRIVYLLYAAAVPSVREVFSKVSWLRETRYEPSLLGHYDWLFFSS